MPSRAAKALSEEIRGLFPAYFSLVMATGIVSIASHLMAMDWIAYPLFYLNIAFYIILWVLLLIRVFRFSADLLADFSDHSRSPGFLTLVAGTNVLGSQFIALAANEKIAFALWILGLALWIFLIYAFFIAMTTKENKPAFEAGISGSWMLIVVSTQSVVVLGMQIGARFAPIKEMFEFSMLGFFFVGCIFYLLVLALIFYRFMFFKLDPKDLTPPYWINMGAVAITTLAGANLILKAESSFLVEIAPFIKGFTVFFWAAGSWWIPLLLLLGAWRHFYKRYPLTYHPLYWSLVFPMGMYTVCTFQLAKAINLPSLLVIPQGFIYLALSAWSLAFIGLLLSRWKALSSALKAENEANNNS